VNRIGHEPGSPGIDAAPRAERAVGGGRKARVSQEDPANVRKGGIGNERVPTEKACPEIPEKNRGNAVPEADDEEERKSSAGEQKCHDDSRRIPHGESIREQLD